ncbi:MAG: hypothetical protein ABGY24_12390, partial [bacterium]
GLRGGIWRELPLKCDGRARSRDSGSPAYGYVQHRQIHLYAPLVRPPKIFGKFASFEFDVPELKF